MAKPHKVDKVEEAAGTYSVSGKKRKGARVSRSPASAEAVRYANAEDFRKAADKVFKTHAELLRKLAQ